MEGPAELEQLSLSGEGHGVRPWKVLHVPNVPPGLLETSCYPLHW